jgi:aarF domain-containing kinase
MLMSRPFDEVIERSKTGSFEAEKQIDNKSDAAMIRGYAQQYLGEIIKLLDKVPRQMLLLFKMNDCLRHIDHALSSNSTTNLVIAGKYAIKATYKNKQSVNVKDWFVYVVAMTRIRLYEVAQWWINIKQHRILI